MYTSVHSKIKSVCDASIVYFTHDIAVCINVHLHVRSCSQPRYVRLSASPNKKLPAFWILNESM